MDQDLNKFASECRFSYQKDWAQFITIHKNAIHHELYSYVQDVYESCNLGKNVKMNPAQIGTVLEKMLGHPNNEPQLVVETIDVTEFCSHLMKECYKTNYAFSHINFLFMKVEYTYGYLSKLGGKLKNKWQERYFILDRVLGVLVYWKTIPVRLFEPSAGIIHVNDFQECEKAELGPTKVAGLNLIPKDKTKKMYQLGASSESDAARWMKEIRKAIQEWQDLKITTDTNLLKQLFRVRYATQYSINQHLQCVTEVPAEE